jgi:hypothetical protein
MDKSDEGLQAVQTCVQLQGRSPLYLGGLGLFYGRATRSDEARKVLAKLQELDQTAYVPSISFAHIYLGLGEIEKCLDCLEKAVDDHDSMITLHFQLPDFDPLRSHPRYHALLRKMNLEP